jgi:small subunit ribosomal protein S2
MIDYKKLVEAGVHFGHKMSRWHPKMAPYIWGYRDGIHLIDVSKSARQLEKAAEFLKAIAADGNTIMWVGTKKPAQEIITQIGSRLNCPFVTHRWIGGSLTNFSQVKKSVTKLLHLEDVVTKASQMHYTKKELVMLQKNIDRLKKNVGSISNMTWPIGAVVVVDVKKEATALREALQMGIPVVALVDTNSDPSFVDYVIPCNDDAPKSIAVILDYLAQAVEVGQKLVVEKPKKAVKEAEVVVEMASDADLEEDELSKKAKDEKPVIKKMKTKEPIKIKKNMPGRSPKAAEKK